MTFEFENRDREYKVIPHEEMKPGKFYKSVHENIMEDFIFYKFDSYNVDSKYKYEQKDTMMGLNLRTSKVEFIHLDKKLYVYEVEYYEFRLIDYKRGKGR